jgi:parvulin-like peptidyl-prolyl isomerase
MRFYKKFTSYSLLLISIVSCQSNQEAAQQQSKVVKSLAPLTSFDPNSVDGVLVSISDKVILFSDFQKTIQEVSNGETKILPNGQLLGGTLDVQKANVLLENMIDKVVLEIKAADLGIVISDSELDSRISEFLKRQNASESDLERQLLSTGQSLKLYRENFRRELQKQELISKVISPFVTVTNDEVNSFYLQQTGTTKQISSVKLRRLMLNLPENFSGNPIEYKPVVDINKAISSGGSFVNLVKKYSSDDVSENEGVLPNKPFQELPKELQAKLVQLKVNDVVGPLVIGHSVFFFQYLGAEFGGASDLKSNYSSWKNKLLNLKFEENLSQYLSNERSSLHVNKRPFVIRR